ncbi:MAG: bifunctional (p)ppGpp synthetase/guanosine-3',5'-bis(diphosphate) 3'-pyrophosphohydrolase [Dechloromonas sp.]|nr:MAG: bifunctional (p)ppGpp synthetase/guanosine-3',5'-bis(diphosphate) 3'-pyrophosphohydrolase [Dechloromonas sp.]
MNLPPSGTPTSAAREPAKPLFQPSCRRRRQRRQGDRGQDPDLVIAAYLHDCIEDCGVTRAEIEERFGEDVATLVAEVTDDKSLPKEERKALQIEQAPHKSARAKILKLADLVANIADMLVHPRSIGASSGYCATSSGLTTSPTACATAPRRSRPRRFSPSSTPCSPGSRN